jgi:hypothetical protein
MQETIFLTLVGCLALLGIYLSRMCWRSLRGNRTNILLIMVIYANFIWSLCPALVAFLTKEFDLFNFGYDLDVWSRGLWLDIVFFSVFILTLKSLGSRAVFEKWAVGLRNTPSPVKFLTWLLFLAGGFYLLMIGPWTGVGYEGAGRYIQDDLSSAGVTVGGVQLTIYRAVLIPALCVLLFYVPKTRVPKWFFYPAAVGFAYVILDAIASGARGKVLEVCFAIGFCKLVAGYPKKAMLYLVGSGILLFIFSSAFLGFRENAEEFAGQSALAKSESVFQAWNQDSTKRGVVLSLTTFLIRLDSVQDAGILADQTSKSGKFATYRPFVGSFLAWVPRYIWPGKPLPLSIDGTVAGLPWYLVMSYRDEPWNNGSVSVAGVAYWQFGWLGVTVTAAFGAVIFRMLSTIALRGGTVGVLFLIVYCMMTHFRLPVGIDETLLVVFQLVVPLLLFHAVYMRLIAHRVVRRSARAQS